MRPNRLKQQLEARASREHRSISAQVVQELSRALIDEAPTSAGERVPVLGRYEGDRLPTDKDLAEVRTALWGRLRGRRG